jgi:hypothetical protein
VLDNADFNELFEFRYLEFKLGTNLDMDELIDNIEPKAHELKLAVKYNPAYTSTCIIVFDDSTTELRIQNNCVTIFIPYPLSPTALIEVYKDTKLKLVNTAPLLLTR